MYITSTLPGHQTEWPVKNKQGHHYRGTVIFLYSFYVNHENIHFFHAHNILEETTEITFPNTQVHICINKKGYIMRTTFYRIYRGIEISHFYMSVQWGVWLAPAPTCSCSRRGPISFLCFSVDVSISWSNWDCRDWACSRWKGISKLHSDINDTTYHK